MSTDLISKLGACRACAHVVSKKAKICPQCGEKNPFHGRAKLSSIVSWSAIIFLIILGISSFNESARTVGTINSNTANTYPEIEAKDMCIGAIKVFVNNPSTLSIHYVTGYATNIATDGTRRITQTFSAKNAFGLKKTFDAYCKITRDGKFDISIQEQNY